MEIELCTINFTNHNREINATIMSFAVLLGWVGIFNLPAAPPGGAPRRELKSPRERWDRSRAEV